MQSRVHRLAYHGGEPVLFQEGHEETETNKDHDVHILVHWVPAAQEQGNNQSVTQHRRRINQKSKLLRAVCRVLPSA